MILTVSLSVCLHDTRVICDETKEHSADILIPHERTITLVFKKGRPLPPNICAQSGPPIEKRRLRLYIFAYNVRAAGIAKGVQLSRLGSRPRTFQLAIDEVRTLP